MIILRCLIADDEPILLRGERSVVRNALGEDTEVLLVTNSDKILEIVNSQDIDIALLDVEMPFINGIETAKKIMAIKPDINIIIISADDGYKEEALSTGVHGFISKPLTEKKLESCLNGDSIEL